MLLVHGSSGPLLGWLAARFGAREVIRAGGVLLALGLLAAAETRAPWHFYVAFGVVAGVGISAAGWVPAVLVVRRWAPERIGTALGVTSAGIGVGMFALIPIVQAMLASLGFRSTLRILAAVVFLWTVPAATWILGARTPAPAPSAPATGSTPRPGRYWTLEAALRSPRFWGVAGVFFAGSLVTQMLLVHHIAYLVDHGVPGWKAATVGGIVGLASIAGKTGWGFLSDRFGREPVYTAAFSCVLASVGVLGLAGRFPGSPLPYLYAVLIGVGYASTAPLTPAIATDLFSGPRFATIFGMLHLCTSVGGAIGAWSAGWLFDATGNYVVALATAAVMAAGAPALLWLVAPRRPNPPPFT
jgi:MFS family permease